MAQRILNTLYVTTQEAYVHKKGDTVLVEHGGNVLLRVPLINLGGIVCFGNVRFSPFLLGAAAKAEVRISFLGENGSFLANVLGKTSGNVLVRREQYRIADDLEQCGQIARAIIGAKILNSRTVIRREIRETSGDTSELEAVSSVLSHRVRLLVDMNDLDQIRGVEGDAASNYFGVFHLMIHKEGQDFTFSERNRRPPKDRVNALISFLYTLVLHDISAALEAHGLDPYVGFLHRDRPGRQSLALDLLEEFRAPLADRLALTLLNRNQLGISDFDGEDGSQYLLNDKGRKTVLMAYQKRKQQIITHPFLNEKMHLGLVFHSQALLMNRWLRKDLDAYPPFIWK